MVGLVAIINSFLMLTTIFTVMGTNTSILRLVPEHLIKHSPTSAFKVYRKTQYMVIVVSIVSGVVLFYSSHLIASMLFAKPKLSYYFALASAFVVFKSLMELNTQAVRGLKLIKLFTLMQFLPQTFNLFLLITIGLIWPASDLPVYAVLLGFTATAITGWLVIESAFKKRMCSKDKVASIDSRTILSISLPMLMAATSTFLIGQTGILMLGIFGTETEVGYYAIAIKLATLTTFVLTAVNAMTAPKFSELYHANQMGDLFYVAKKSAKLIFAVITPILLLLLIFGRPLLIFAYGQDFVVAYPALVILIIGQFVNSISGPTGMFLNMTEQQKIYRNIMGVAAVANIGLNFWLIPWLGMNGAAIAAALSLCSWNVAILIYVKRKFGKTTGYFPILFNLRRYH